MKYERTYPFTEIQYGALQLTGEVDYHVQYEKNDLGFERPVVTIDDENIRITKCEVTCAGDMPENSLAYILQDLVEDDADLREMDYEPEPELFEERV